jgi:MscS family membrane protein
MRVPFPGALAALLACVLFALALPPAGAQIPLRPPSPAPAASANVPQDPLDRGTPRRTIVAFARAAQRGDLALAARYAQVGKMPQARAEAVVGDLAGLMDRHFHQPVTTISDAPEGALDDGLAPDRERVGPLRIGGEDRFIELVRVQDPQSGPIWLISADTLNRVAAYVEAEDGSWPERMMPRAFLRRAFFDFTFADLSLWAASLVLPLLLLPPLLRLGRLLLRRLLPAHQEVIDAWYDATRWPSVLLFSLGIHDVALGWYGPTLSFRIAYSRLLAVALVGVLAWGTHSAATVGFRRAGARLEDGGHSGARSVVLLGQRLLNMLILLVAGLSVLSIAGFDMGTVLAGLGIVGVAVALGAQKTIENILGGMMLLGDEAIAVGDFCRVNNRLGTVEDITLRSVRFRTLDQTLLSIPAGVLAQAELENFATRGRIFAQHRLRLHHTTSAEQLRRVREEIAQLIETHPQLAHPVSRVRLVEFGPQGPELEIFAYVLTRDMPTFLEIREDLLLKAVEVMAAAGVRFADPAPWTAAGPPP